MRCPTPLNLPDPYGSSKKDRIQVPCGRCGACKANRRSEWSFRLAQELKDSHNAFFITLTYSDEDLPYEYVDKKTGEIITSPVPTLEKIHFQNFLKKIRTTTKREFPTMPVQLRYYCVGEYGTQTQRPHYHAIMFNMRWEYARNLSRFWKFGHHHIGQVTDQSIHYVSKYHVDREYWKDDKIGRQRSFATMSRKPGIGYNYVEKNSDWNKENSFFL